MGAVKDGDVDGDVDVDVVGAQGGWRWRLMIMAWGELRRNGVSGRSGRSGVRSETLQGEHGTVGWRVDQLID